MGSHDAALENYRAMIAFARRAGDVAMQGDALNHLVTMEALRLGPVPEVTRLLNEALALARMANDQELLGRALWNTGLVYRFRNPLRALGYFRQARDLALAAGLPELAAFALTDVINIMRNIGRARLAVRYAEEALAEWRALDNKPMIADILGGMAFTLIGLGEAARARAAAEEAMSISQAIENPWGIAYSEWSLTNLDVSAGQFERALAYGERGLARTRLLSFPIFITFALTSLARLWLELDDLERAQALIEEGAHAVEGSPMAMWVLWAQGIRGRVYMRQGALDQARSALDPAWYECEDPVANLIGFAMAGPPIAELALVEDRIADGLRFCNWLLECYEREEIWGYAAEMYDMRGRLHLANGDLASAETDLLRARELLEASENRIVLWRTNVALADLYARRGDAEQARAAHERAAQLVRTLADGISDVMLRQAFLRRQDVAAALQPDVESI
jgi:tetratricopeptide (TPR) repeat protein